MNVIKKKSINKNLNMQERIVESRKCNQCNTNFDITNFDLVFYKKISPMFDGEIFSIPTPTLCPDCRLQRRLSWRNDKNLYRNKCSESNKDIISIYSPNKSNNVYDHNLWWSDEWDAILYQENYDFKRNFFDQF